MGVEGFSKEVFGKERNSSILLFGRFLDDASNTSVKAIRPVRLMSTGEINVRPVDFNVV
jgi:hypothetical protein